MPNVIHLWTGLRVCTRLQSWCGAPIVVICEELTNATDARERVTCEACLMKLREADEAATARALFTRRMRQRIRGQHHG